MSGANERGGGCGCQGRGGARGRKPRRGCRWRPDQGAEQARGRQTRGRHGGRPRGSGRDDAEADRL